MRVLCAAALSLSFGLWVAFAQDKRPAETKVDRAARLEELKKRFDEENKELIAKFQKAKAPTEAQGIQTEMRELALITAGKVLAVAEGDPKDGIGLDAAVFIVKTAASVRTGGPEVEKAVAIIAEYHVADPKVKDVLVPAMRMGAAGEKLLKSVSEKAADKGTKGLALLLRGFVKASAIDDEEDDAQIALAVKDATALLEEAAKVAPDALVGDHKQTIAKVAETKINEMKEVAALGVGKPAPEVESLQLDGKRVKLSDYKGKVVLLDVWATWCGPCRAMIPHERELVEKNKEKPFVLISVSVDDKKETLEKFLEKEKMPWVHWWDNGPETAVAKKYRVRAFPTLYLIDHNGIVKHKWIGVPGNDKIDAAVEELVKAAPKAQG